MAKIYTYEVTGTGSFPLDMLRYDAAYPASPRAVDTLMDASRGFNATSGVRFTLRLRSHYPPTIERWRSFTWGVVKGSLRQE